MGGTLDPSSTRTSARFHVTASRIGFSPPPAPLRVKLVNGPAHATLYIQPLAPTALGPIVEWIAGWGPLRVEFGTRDVLRADFDPVPRAWSVRFRSLDLDTLHLNPGGAAEATVSGPRAAVAAFARQISARGDPVDVVHLADARPHARLLTHAQDVALREAVSAGYYNIPRPVNLHALSRRLGVSSASLSERLRRAEGRVITRYVNEGARSPWDDRTLFDAYPGDDERAC